MSVAPAVPLRIVTRRPVTGQVPPARPSRRPTTLRTATLDDVDVIHRLIAEHQAEGHLLPRDRTDIARRAARFVVAVRGSRIAGCAELVPLSRSLAEIRSLVVDGRLRGARLGALVVDELVARATRAGHDRLCALTHAPGYFVRLGFSIVPHIWLPEKIVADCHACPQFRHCGQYAVVRDLPSTRMLSVAPGRG